MPVQNPPSQAAIYQAVVDVVSEHGVRGATLTTIARRARTHRQFLHRHWPDSRKLLTEALHRELAAVLRRALVREPVATDPVCRIVEQVVHATRLVRHHPVKTTVARTDPGLLPGAVLDHGTPLHGEAWQWIRDRLWSAPHGTFPHEQAVATAVLLTALPFAVMPPRQPAPAASDPLDEQLTLMLHGCLAAPVQCPNCPAQ